MDKESAETILNETFLSEFDINKFGNFIKELFNDFKLNQQDIKRYLPKEYNDFVDSFHSLGTYMDDSKNFIQVFAVGLKRTSSRDRARTMQRNLIAKFLEKKDRDAALVAFYGDEPEDWRFSFVKMEYELVKEDGKVKPRTKLTPAKRSSYLVGLNEPNHTCRTQFLDLIREEDIKLTLEQIEAAFSIESVTKEFFTEYKKLFLDLKESLEAVIKNDPVIEKEFNENNLLTTDFAKKLLGQIVFIYFLQKKGWLGVGRQESWGNGPKNFLRRLFEGEMGSYENFFNDMLEPLFYEALATERDGDYYSRFNCRIPFLNGGLFEPANDYDWVGTDITLNNKIFKEILNTFDLFNFTIKEDEPLEKEVAVDPEMLGKVFENLLEVTDRKSKGAFYTPREIVHYMCQQSLINYLETNLKDIPLEDIEYFIQKGEFALDIIIKQQEQKKKYHGQSVQYKTIPESIKENSETINQLLKDIKVVDPAVGSGAFPVGMMNEIVRARSILSILSEIETKNYDLKRETIENCLYGVDIDSSAVDITKLRFWLSLVVDEDIKNIKPLPNLDHKIMCGNSLIDEFEGMKLFDENIIEFPKIDPELEIINSEKDHLENALELLRNDGSKNFDRITEIDNQISKLRKKAKKIISKSNNNSQLSLFASDSQKKLKLLKEKHESFFNEESPSKKKTLRQEIESIEWEFIEETLKAEGHEKSIEKLEDYKNKKSKPFFIWKLYFAEIFRRENPGFDIVIANPPYVGEKGNKELFQEIVKSYFGKKFYLRRMDLFYYFFHLALDLSRNDGIISFITTNYFPTADGAKKLRIDLKNRSSIITFIDFNEFKIFESAKGQHNMITIFKKTENRDRKAAIGITKNFGESDPKILNKILGFEDENTNYYSVKQKNLYDSDDCYLRLRYNSSDDPFSQILFKCKNNSSELGNICNLDQGIVSGADKVSDSIIRSYPDLNLIKGEGIFVLTDDEVKNFDENDLKFFKRFYKNSDINRWSVHPKRELFVIYLKDEGEEIELTSNLKKHFEKFKPILLDKKKNCFKNKWLKNIVKPWLDRGNYFVLFYPRNENIFNALKIVNSRRSKINNFALENKKMYEQSDIVITTLKPELEPHWDLKYILALLNSKLYYFWFYNRGKRKGELLELFQTPLSKVPIKNLKKDQQSLFTNIVDNILDISENIDYLTDSEKQIQLKDLEDEINYLIYDLFEMKPEEIHIIEDFFHKKANFHNTKL